MDKISRKAAELALSMYAGELCRICGEEVTMDDLHDNAVYAGYAKNVASRIAHRLCWEKSGTDKSVWAFPEDE